MAFACAAAVAGLLAALLAAAPAAAQTDVWTATLTPADFGSGLLGCNNASATSKCSTATVLSDDDFTYDSTDYSVTILYLNATAFTLTVDTDITAATNALTVVVGSTSLAFADAGTAARTKTWFNPGFSWTAGTAVSIRIPDTTPPELTSAAVAADGNSITVTFDESVDQTNLPAAGAFSVAADGAPVTVSGVSAGTAAQLVLALAAPGIRAGQVVTLGYTDPTDGDDTSAVQDTSGNDAVSFSDYSVTNNSIVVTVPSDWTLKPTGLAVGDQFRLLFLSSTKRDGSSTDIATYNTFVQTRAAAGHADIRTYSTGFRAVGCTADTDARDTTYTTYTSTDKGVPIYWLNGAKAADQYEDFYDGTWDDEANDKNESGTNGPNTSLEANYPLTGCNDRGTEYFDRFNRSSALAKIEVMVGRPNSSAAASHGPLSSNTALDVANTVTRPMYGLSAVFEVAPDTTPPTLTSADVEETNGLTIYLEFSEDLQLSNPPLASAFTLTVDGSAVTGFSVAWPGALLPQNELWLQLSTAIRQGQAVVVTYTDPTAGNDTAAIQDTTGNDAADFTTGMNSVPAVINNSTVANAVLAGWSLTPTGLAVGDQFRLLFLSSTKRDAAATDIATYNTFIQTRAAAGHTDIQAYSAGFRVVGCTAATDARDNTETTYISTAKGVAIYWLNGAKAADEYEDFYDGTWDDEANDKNESGTDAHDTSQTANWPWTGCNHNGTEFRQFAGTVSRGLGSNNDVRYGRPDSSTVNHGPLNGLQNGPKAENRPLYGLSALFQVAGEDTTPPTLTSADVEITDALIINLVFSEDLQLSNPPALSAFTVTVDGSAATVSSVLVPGSVPPQNELWLQLSTAIRQRQAVVVTYTDATSGDDTAAIQDTAGNDAATFTTGMDGVPAVTNNSTVTKTVPADWSLIPTGLSTGDKFRLLFLSSTKRNSTATDIADYNTFIQTRAAAGHTDIQDYSADFRAVGCTADTDARDNTKTTYTTTAKGVPIYWLNGAKAADEYEDFYDGSWDDEANDKNESGTDAHDTSQNVNWPWTGCDHDGTEAVTSGDSFALGTNLVDARVGRPNSSASGHGPLNGQTNRSNFQNSPLYGLSEVFQVAAAVVVPNNPPTVATAIPDQSATAGTAFSYVFPANTFSDADTGDTLSYTATKADGTALPTWLAFTAGTRTFAGTPQAADAGTVSVKVTASDGNGGSVSDTFDITVAADTTPPTLTSVEVLAFGNILQWRFSENLNVQPGNLPPFSAFTVTADGRALTTNTVVRIPGVVDGFLLQLSSPFILQGQTVVVTYTDPTAGDDANAIQDTAGNDAATFTTGMDSVPAVTNNSTATNNPATGAPAITGTAQVGQTLTAGTTAIMDAEGLTTPGYTYQWIRTAAGVDTNISGATASTYTLVAADLGTTVKVRVSFTDDLNNAETLTSAATAAVSANNPPTSSNKNLALNEDTELTFFASDFPFTDADGNSLSSVKILSLPATDKGTLTFSGMALTSGDLPQTVPAAQFNSLKYVPPANENGGDIPFTSFTFRVNDGTDDSAATYTLTFLVYRVNDAATGQPGITGTAQVGQTLAATAGTIADVDGLPDPFLTDTNTSFQWVRVTSGTDADISGARDSTYTLVADDEGKKIKVKVSFLDTEATTNQTEGPLTSAATATVSASTNTRATGAPTITGTAQVGQTLTAGITAIMDDDGLTNVSYTYQWIRTAAGVDTNISSATASTYTLVAADLGTTVKVRVSFTDDASNAETLTSAATAAVSAAPNTPATGAPTITGTPTVGETLTAGTTAIVDADGLTTPGYTYQWIRVATDNTETNISMATTSTYTLVTDDLGTTIKVKVSFTDDASNAETLTSVATAAVAADTTPPTLTSADVEETDELAIYLEFSEDLQLSNPPPASAFTLTVDGSAVTGFSVAWPGSLLPQNSIWLQLSTAIRQGQVVVVTYTDPTADDDTLAIQDIAGNDAATFTTGMDGVPAVTNNSTVTNTPATGAPTITGTAQVGQTLTAGTTAIMDADGLTSVSYTYQWIRTATGVETNISGATASTYTLVAADLGTTIKVRVSFTDDASNAETLTSAATAAVSVVVPADWSLKPTAVAAGDKFRLLFLSSTKRNGSSTDIATYNTFVQERAAAGHADIRTYSAGFRAVGCTSDVDARDNTRTTGTGVPIYWLNGAKAADNYADFYDGSWDDEVNDKNESGTNGPDTSQSVNRPFTGCEHNGTEALDGSISQGFGAAGGTKVGRPNSSSALHGPLSSNAVTGTANTRPMYGLSAVFQVAAAVVVPNNPPAFSADTAARSVAENTAAGQNVGAALTATDADSDTLTYTLEGTDAASFDIVSGSGQIRTRTGVTYNHEAKSTHTVVVKADDGNGGTDTVTVTITVTDVDEPPGQPAAPSVSATAGSTTSLDVTWTAPTNTGPAIASYDLQYRAGTSGNFTNGPQNVTGTSAAIGSLAADTSYEVQVRATNAEGDGDWSVAGTGRTTATSAPGAPTGLTATASGTTAINLSWSAPASTGGSAITGYKIEVSPNGTSSWTDQVANTNSTATTYAHTGLAAGDTRHYRVSAINTNGAGTASNVDSATTGTTVPGAPTGLTATASGTTAINLSWSAPASTGGSAITGYKIEVSPNGTSSWTDQVANTNSTATTYAHTGLAAGDTRHYRVSAINTNGAGTASNVDSATTGATAPGAPTGLTATASGTTAINLSWSAPASTGGSAITGYKIEVSPNGTSGWTDQVANTNSTATTYAHTGLTAGDTRHYRVSAINTNGTGTASNVDSATTGATVPGAPTGLTATASGTTAINLSWSAPASTGGSAITGYKIEVSPNGTSSWTDQVADTNSTATTYAHTGLAAGDTRHYRVSAINTNGAGTASNVDSATTGATVPGAPTGLTATASGTTAINLSWSAPASTGGSAITGYKIEVSPNGTSSWTDQVANTNSTATTYAHTGLAAGDTRHYRVSAINTNGAGTASNVDSATTGTTVPGAPTGLTATASGTTAINLSWSAPASTGGSAITGYKIEVSPNGTSSWTDQVADTNSTATTYAHTGLAAGDTRHYRVSAINTNGAGTASNVDSATTGATVPGAPTGLSATASGTTAINLSWSAPASTGGSAITGYKIEVSPNGTSGWTDQVANTNSTATTYAHTGLTAGDTRHYRVSAINTNGTGTASNVDSATTGATVPGAPTGLTATASGTTAINLSWSAPASTGGSAITGYKIEVSPNGTSGWTDQVADTNSTATTYAHTGLTAGDTRHYRVSAINANGTGTASNVDSATTGQTTVTPTLTSADVEETDELAIYLEFSEDLQLSNPPPASAFTLTVDGSAVTGFSVAWPGSLLPQNSIWLQLSTAIRQGQAVVVTYTDPTAGDDANAIQDTAGNDAATFTTGMDGVPAVTNNSTVTNTVPADWSLIPTGLSTGDKFRLLFLSSTKRNASSTDIADYNTFIQIRAAAGHTDIRAYSAGFRAVGCTAAVDARDNTKTTYTTSDKGVPIYWLNGAKAADQYEDFYDGSWDDEANDKNESGTNGLDTSQISNYPVTGCDHDGTENFTSTNLSQALGSTETTPGIGRPNSSGSGHGPLGSNSASSPITRPLYGLSAVFQVAAAVVTTVPGAPTGLTATASGTTAINLSWSAPASTGGSAITGYKIEVSSDGGSSWSDLVANTSNTTTTYAHTGLTAGDTRHYRVSAINANGAGTASNVDSATTGTTGETTVTFTGSSYTASEGQGEKAITVELSAAPSARVRIPLAVTHLGGATAADYSGVPSSVTFAAGRTRFTFGVKATDDADADDGERVRIGFGTLPDGYAPGERPTATVTLEDNDNADLLLNFGTERHTVVKVLESDTVRHRFTLSLSTRSWGPPDGNPQQPVTIPLVVTRRGGATAADYKGIPEDVTFAVGQSVTDFFMMAIPDGKREPGEGLRLDFGPLPPGVRKGTWGPHETIEFVDQVLPGYTVLFGAEAYTATEGGADARVSIHLNEPVEIESVEVRLLLKRVGATAADYTGIPKSVRFAVGEQTQTITVKATDDTDDDDGESVTLSFVNDPNGRVRVRTGSASATVALADNDGLRRVTVSFGAVTYTATEGGADATVRVELDAAPGRPVTVPLTKAHLGNATAADYSGIPMNVTFAANQTLRTFAVMATAGDGSDGGESVSIGFGTLPEGVFAGSPAATTVTLADGGEQRLVVNFGSSRGHTVQVREGARRLRLNVLLDSSPRRPVTIPLVVTHVGGATEADYAAIPESVTFAAGQTSAHYYVRALPDEEKETGEGLRLDFGPLPPGVRKGTWGPYETIAFVDAGQTANLSVAGLVLTLDYPWALDGGSTPSPRDFVVSAEVPGGAKDMVPVAAVSLQGSDVFLQLDRPVAPDETVTLTYLTAAMHPIRAAAGRPAAPLTDEPVLNVTGASGPLAEAGLAAGTTLPAPIAAMLEAAQEGAGTERLDLSSRNLTELSALAGLSGLRELDLRHNAITDLSPLAGLTGLEVLNLSGNRIEELWPLAGLTALQRLDLSGNRIEDIATLAELTGLEVLDLSGNRIEELWPLAGLTALQRLDLSDNRIEELWPLAGLSGLQVLLLDRNRVADVLALSPLAELANLGLSGNQITDIGLLTELGRLHRLDLSGNAVADVSALGDVSGLVWLQLPGNPVSDVTPLGRLEKLLWLWLDSRTAAGMEALAPPAGRGEAQLWIELTPAQ